MGGYGYVAMVNIHPLSMALLLIRHMDPVNSWIHTIE